VHVENLLESPALATKPCTAQTLRFEFYEHRVSDEPLAASNNDADNVLHPRFRDLHRLRQPVYPEVHRGPLQEMVMAVPSESPPVPGSRRHQFLGR
jgi:hypothetical protein